MVDLARLNWRDYEVDGVAASGKHKPNKAKIRQWGTWVEGFVGAFTTNGGLIFGTRALLYADLLHGANTSAWVVSDSTAAYNGIYQKSGISGAGAWTRVADLPYSFIACADSGAGTANAIIATSSIPAPSTAGAALFLCNIFEANSGAVTLALNGAAAKPVVTNSGNALASGYLVAGMQVVFIDGGANWRLVSDVASAAVLAGAEAAQVAAELAAANAALYDGVWFDTAALMLADTTRTYGNTTAGDYIRTRAEGFAYLVAASGASDHDLTTAGGVKIYMLPSEEGVYSITQAGGVLGEADSSTAFIAAAGDGGRTVYFGPGTWKLNYSLVPSNTKIIGAQWLTKLEPINTDIRAILTADSGSSSAFIDDVTIKHIVFRSMTTPTFSEQKHLVTLNGASNWTFEECQFFGWRGDAVYIGSGDAGGVTERHNKNIRFGRCLFDGVNRENRQAISVIDCDGFWASDNVFQNCTKSTMPGTIDFEPNANAFHIIRNIWIERNKFVSNGGNVGLITFAFNASTCPDPYNINVIGNVQEGSNQSAASAFVYFATGRAVSATSVEHKITIKDNLGDGLAAAGAPMVLWAAKGVVSEGNTWRNYTQMAIIGYTTAGTQTSRDITIRDRFVRCGSAVDSGIDVHNVDGLDLSGSVFDDCGDASGSSAAIGFKSGTSTRVKLNGIKTVSPTGKTIRATLKDGGHTFTPATNECFSPDIGSMALDFQAIYSDTIWTSYTPIIEGSTSAGAGTYTVQFGRYRMRGKQVQFQLKLAIAAGHTGTGIIEAGLPTLASAASGNAEQPIPIMVNGAATTGGQSGWINPAVTVNSLGGIRCFHTATGTLTNTTIPAGAFDVYAAGEYTAA